MPFQTAHEEIAIAGSAPLEYDVLIVPQHGPIVPTIVNHAVVPPDPTKGAMSVEWTGFKPTNELPAVLTGFLRATNVEDFRTAIRDFAVGAQNWVVADTSGNIFYTTQSQIPLRDKRAYTWDPATFTGTLPCFVEPGDGTAEWIGPVPRRGVRAAREEPAAGVRGNGERRPGGRHAGQRSLERHVLPNGQPIYMACCHDPGFRVGPHPPAHREPRAPDVARRHGDHPGRRPLAARRRARARARDVARARHGRGDDARLAPGPDRGRAERALPGGARSRSSTICSSQWGSQADYDTPPGREPRRRVAAQRRDECRRSEATLLFNVWMMRMPIAVLGDELTAIGRGRPVRSEDLRVVLTT